jgi:hypothetical protein
MKQHKSRSFSLYGFLQPPVVSSVFENRVVRRIFGPKREQGNRGVEKTT